MEKPAPSIRHLITQCIARPRLLRDRAMAWLRVSLRRWLLAPMATTIVILFLAVAGIGSYATQTMIERSQADALQALGLYATGTFENYLANLGTHARLSARMEGVIEAVRGGDASVAVTELRTLSEIHDLQTIALCDVWGQGVTAVNQPLGLTTPTGWSDPFLAEPAIQQSVQNQLAVQFSSAGGEVGLIRHSGLSLVYALGQVPGETNLLGIVALSASLPNIMESVTAVVRAPVVLYDVEGLALFSTLAAPAGDLDGIVVASRMAARPKDDRPLMLITRLVSEKYRQVIVPIHNNGELIGYMSVWQALSGLTGQIRLLQLAFFLVAGVLMALTMRMGISLVDQVVQPIRMLAEVASAIAAGDVTHPVPQPAVSDLIPLATALDRMAGQVRGQTDALRDQVSRANYLFEASAELGSTLNLDDSLQTAAEAIWGLGGLAYIVVLVGRGEVGPYKCRAIRGLPPEVAGRVIGQTYAVPLWGVMARVLVSRQPLIIDDVVAQRRPPEGEFDWEVGGSMLLFPVAGATGSSGLIIVGAEKPGRFTTDGLGDMIFALARIATHSILNAQLFHEATRAQEQLVTLQMISRVVASASGTGAVLDTLVREAADMTGNCQAWLYLKNGGEGHIGRLHGRHGLTPLESWSSIHQEAVAWVIRAGQPVFYHPEQALALSPVLVYSGPAMCVPLEVGDEIIGAFVVVSEDLQRYFAEEELIALRILANSGAAGLYTAQLTERFHAHSA